jgi:hypothetical protein
VDVSENICKDVILVLTNYRFCPVIGLGISIVQATDDSMVHVHHMLDNLG